MTEDRSTHTEPDAAYRRGATDALMTLMREWRGGSGHTDGNMWVNFTDIKSLLARYQTRVIPSGKDADDA